MLTKLMKLLARNRVAVAGAMIGVAMLLENKSRRPIRADFDRLVATSFAAGLMEEHNTTASMPAQDLSELSRSQLGAAHVRFTRHLEEAVEARVADAYRVDACRLGLALCGVGLLWLVAAGARHAAGSESTGTEETARSGFEPSTTPSVCVTGAG